MKNLNCLYTFILLFFCDVSGYGQVQSLKDTVYITSSDIKKMVDDKYYVRIPSSDLEQRLQDKVSDVVNDKFNTIYGLIGVISFLIGSILLFNLRNVVSARIDKELKDNHLPALNTRLTEHIREVKESISSNFADLDKEIELKIENYYLKNFKITMDVALAKLQEEQQKALTAQEDFSRKSIEILKVFDEIRFEKLRTNRENRKDLQKTWDGLKGMLAQADKNNDSELISKVIDELSYVSFYLKKENEFEKIIDAYADRTDVDINEASFVNIAVGALYDYNATGDATDREKPLKYLNRALRKTPDYGEALGLKLELFMIDYDIAFEDTKKEIAKREAERIFETILSKEISAFETLTRFTRVQASSAKSKYINLMFSIFPEQMKKLEEMAAAYKSNTGKYSQSLIQ